MGIWAKNAKTYHLLYATHLGIVQKPMGIWAKEFGKFRTRWVFMGVVGWLASWTDFGSPD